MQWKMWVWEAKRLPQGLKLTFFEFFWNWAVQKGNFTCPFSVHLCSKKIQQAMLAFLVSLNCIFWSYFPYCTSTSSSYYVYLWIVLRIFETRDLNLGQEFDIQQDRLSKLYLCNVIKFAREIFFFKNINNCVPKCKRKTQWVCNFSLWQGINKSN